MKKIFVVLTAFLFGFSFYAKADMYAVYGIHVDVTAQNATQAKEQGVTEAQEKAFYKVLDRLTLVKDMEALPVLSTEDVLNLVKDFSVSHEKTSSVRYIADVDVQFNPEAIQNFFQEHRVPYVTAVAETSIVFPVFKTAGSQEIVLWKDTNNWSRMLTNAAKSSDLVPLAVPLGDLDDMAIVNENNWNDEANLDITPLLKRYNSTNALVAELTVMEKENVIQVLLRPFQNKDGAFSPITITEPIDAPMPMVLKRCADRVVYLLEQSWREHNAVRFDDPTQLAVSVAIKDLAQWLEIRKHLDKIPLIKQYVVKALRRDKAEIEVFYAGDLDTFKNILKKEDLFLSANEDGSWLLRVLSEVPEDELNPKPAEDIMADEENPLQESEPLPPTQMQPSDEEQAPAAQEQNAPEPEKQETQEKQQVEEPDDVAPIRTFDMKLYERVQPETMEIFNDATEE